jgi:succinoglycan biosynthesis transport protein ExoP
MQASTQGSTAVGTGTREAHLRDYWRIIWQGRLTVLTIFGLAVALAVLRVSLATPIYEAGIVLEIRPEARRILPGQEQWVGDASGGWLGEEKYFNTQLEVLKSRDLAQRAFRELGLAKHPEFTGLSDPTGAFGARIRVRPKVNTRLVTVSIQGKNPKEVRDWVNTLGECYVQRNVDEATASFEAILDEIRRGLDEFRAKLGEAEQSNLQTAADAQLFVPESQQEVLRQSLTTFNESFNRLRVQLGGIGAELASLERMQQEGGDLLALPRFNQDPEIQTLLQQKVGVQRELDRVAQEKLPRHPEYLAKKTELEKIDRDIKDQVARVITKLRNEYRLAAQNVDYLAARIRETERQSYAVRQASSAYEIAKGDAESKRKVYDVVAETMQRLTLGAQLISMNNNVAVLDRAVEPRAPVRPRKMLAVGMGCLLGLMFGVGAVLALDYFDNTVRTPEDVEQYLGLSILGIVPRVREANTTAAREAFQSLRTSILFSSHNREKKVLLFTSAGPQEGKSSTVAQVARALASAGDRVVVLDCDLRRPTQHHHMQVTREPGLSNYLMEGREGDYDRYLHATEVPSLKVFTCGPIPPNPPDLIGLPRFRNLLADLRREYDWVLIDSPPVASLADSVLLASMSEMMAIVIKHNQNDRDLIRRSVKRLRDVNPNIIGAVLNQVGTGRGSDAYYGGYYYYGSPDPDSDRRRIRKTGGGRGDGDGQGKDRVAL